jgi:hypothetical protein
MNRYLSAHYQHLVFLLSFFLILSLPSAAQVDWYSLGIGVSGASSPTVYAVALAGGNTLYAGGSFTNANSSQVNRIAYYTGNYWVPVSGSGLNGTVYAILIDGSNIYVGGDFTDAGGNPNADHIARWDGTQWNALGTGTDSSIYAIAKSGNNLYVGGKFVTAGGQSASRVARWDLNASTWHALGDGVSSNVHALAANGNNLYVGGTFTFAGGVSFTNRIARWNEASDTWHKLDKGVNSAVYALALKGNDVFVGGAFNSTNENPAIKRLARWDEATDTWHGMGDTLNRPVSALAIYGNNLYAGGAFSHAGPLEVNSVAQINVNTLTWTALARGVNGTVSSLAATNKFLYAGGGYGISGCPGCNGIARFGEEPFPVEWLTFGAELHDEAVSLSWATASELNNMGFAIERSVPGGEWEEIGFLPGAGSSATEQQYRWTDERPALGKSFYRLRQMDFDGAFNYSTVLSVRMAPAQASFAILPNPASQATRIVLADEGAPARVELYDLSGRKMQVQDNALDEASLSLAGLLPGMYVVRVIQNRASTLAWLQVQ